MPDRDSRSCVSTYLTRDVRGQSRSRWPGLKKSYFTGTGTKKQLYRDQNRDRKKNYRDHDRDQRLNPRFYDGLNSVNFCRQKSLYSKKRAEKC
jgi:hypothetical protein